MEARAFAAGSAAKSDCRVVYRPSPDGGGGLEVLARSSVGALFGRAIEAAARRAAADCGASTGTLEIEDDGALDYVLEARVEAALRLAGFPHAGRTAGAGPAVRGPSPRLRPRRARLYLPGDQPHFAVNAGLLGADVLVFDLEDAVAEGRKFESRILVRRILEESPMLGSCEIAVRVNPLSGPWGMEDLAEVVGARPQVIVLPKCESAEDLRTADEALVRLESEAGLEPGFVRLMPIVETARGALAAAAIAAAPRVVALCFGAEDFRRDIGASGGKAARADSGPAAGASTPGQAAAFPDPCLLARQMVVLAARAAGVDPVDSVYADIEDTEGLARSCAEARALGFSGKGLLHPGQVAAALAAFAPAPGEIAAAERIVQAFDAAAREGRGAIAVDGSMVDLPVAERARAILAAAGRAALEAEDRVERTGVRPAGETA